MILSTLFWLSVFLVVYAYFGYPILVWFLSRFKKKITYRDGYEPNVTLLISAYNESAVIEKKIENCLALDYPSEKLQILISVDGEDGTSKIVESYADRGVELVVGKERQGKMIAIKRGMKVARGEIIIMSDANNRYSINAVRALVAPFSNPKVGMVSGAKHVSEGDGALGSSEGFYWKYESWIKTIETRLASCINVAGEINSFRKHLFGSPPNSIINDDFYMMMSIIKQGYSVVYAPKARSWERVSKTAAGEVERRARINAGRYQAMAMSKHLLPFKQPLVFWQVISHKFLRPFVAFAMLGAFITNLLIVISHPSPDAGFFHLASPWNQLFLSFQLLFYTFAALGKYIKSDGLLGKIFYIPTFLVNSNWAALLGFWRFASRRQSTIWQRVQRRDESDK